MRILAYPSAALVLVIAAWASCAAPSKPATSAEQVAPPAAQPIEAPAPAPVDAAPAEATAPPRRADGSRGGVVVSYTPTPDPILLNEPFELVVEVRSLADPAQPVEGADVYVTGWMPDHLHGMVRQPRTLELGGGSYKVTGLLFHMPGHWELRVDVVVAPKKPERAVFDVYL